MSRTPTGASVADGSGRAAEVERNLAAVRRRIRDAAQAAGRNPDDITLIVVTKTYPADDLEILASLGIEDVGENRLEELLAKGPVAGSLGMRVHAVGRIQSNKAARFAAVADLVHSVDRLQVIERLDRGRAKAGRGPLDVLLQVSLDGDPNRGGALPEQLDALARAVDGAAHLHLCGLMAVAPLEADPDEAFAELERLAQSVRQSHSGATWVSAGMSADLEAAIRHGATHVRVGAAVLGTRPRVR